ncbi:MAG: sigma-70 family RNA polymerase sigma factor [Candidatus Omnitrophota bacterium]|jgi:RNA polymerase sigma factor (sigma-70 family)
MHFKELQSNLSPVIKRIAYKLNGRYRTFSHDDLFQEALMHLWTNFTAGKLEDKTESYILQGCYFHLKNYIRKVNEKPDLSLDEMISYDFNDLGFKDLIVDNHQSDIRELLDTKLLADTIQNNGFDPREKRVLMLLKNGLTMRDIGKSIGVSHVSIVKMMQKIRIKSKKYLDKI